MTEGSKELSGQIASYWQISGIWLKTYYQCTDGRNFEFMVTWNVWEIGIEGISGRSVTAV